MTENKQELYELLSQIDNHDHEQFEMMDLPSDIKSKIRSQDESVFSSVLKALTVRIAITSDGLKAELEPAIIWYGKGRTVGPQDFTEEDYSNLKNLQKERLPLSIRARVQDVLWLQTHDYNAALDAAECYHHLFQEWITIDEWAESLAIIERAFSIARQLKNKKKEEILYTIYQCLIENKDSNKIIFLNRLLDLLTSQHYGNPDEYIRILTETREQYSGEIISCVEDSFDLQQKCYKWKNDSENKDLITIQKAKFYEAKANSMSGETSRDIWIAIELLKKAHKIYKDKRQQEQADNILRKIDELQKKLILQMQSFISEKDCSQIAKDIETKLQGMTLEESLFYFALLTRVWGFDEIKKQLLDKSSTFSNLVSTEILDKQGRVIAKLPSLESLDPEEDSDAIKKHMYHKAEKLETENGLHLKIARQIIVQNHQITKEAFRVFTDNNGIIPDGREHIFLSAFELFFSGKEYEAMHILIPQTEHMIRTIAKELGGSITRFTKEGFEEDKSLGEVFKIPELIEGYDERLFFLLRGMMIEGAGSNLRNKVAHGLLEEDEATSEVCYYFVGLVIKILNYTAPKCYQLLNSSDKLQKIMNNIKQRREKQPED